jgi:TRAP transporter TAXI family solute receptor
MSRNSLGRYWGLTLVLLVAAAALVLFLMQIGEETGAAPLTIRIATGQPGGTYHPLGRGLAVVLEDRLPGVVAEALPTAGSLENMALLEKGDVELALVQNDTRGGPTVRSIAPLYQELLHIVVRRELERDHGHDAS